MLRRGELQKIARSRLQDATKLLTARRYDGAVYLSGYAVEVALKLRICRTLGWQGYPATAKEFANYRSLKTHRLDVLLHFSGVERRVKNERPAWKDWLVVAQWDPEARYRPVGNAQRQDATRRLVHRFISSYTYVSCGNRV